MTNLFHITNQDRFKSKSQMLLDKKCIEKISNGLQSKCFLLDLHILEFTLQVSKKNSGIDHARVFGAYLNFGQV